MWCLHACLPIGNSLIVGPGIGLILFIRRIYFFVIIGSIT